MSTDNEPNAKVATEKTGETTTYYAKVATEKTGETTTYSQLHIIPKHQWIACFRMPHADMLHL
jgi:hypothetical protein